MNNKTKTKLKKILRICIYIFIIFYILSLVGRVEKKESEIDNLQQEILRLRKLPVYDMNPTLEDVERNLEEVSVSDLRKENYTCIEYSTTLINRFLENNIHSCYAWLITGVDVGHAVVTVNTSDYGIIYIEPQTDEILFNISEGYPYCEKLNWNCNWTITQIKSCFTKLEWNS
jgi:hypothetical protein